MKWNDIHTTFRKTTR